MVFQHKSLAPPVVFLRCPSTDENEQENQGSGKFTEFGERHQNFCPSQKINSRNARTIDHPKLPVGKPRCPIRSRVSPNQNSRVSWTHFHNEKGCDHVTLEKKITSLYRDEGQAGSEVVSIIESQITIIAPVQIVFN